MRTRIRRREQKNEREEWRRARARTHPARTIIVVRGDPAHDRPRFLFGNFLNSLDQGLADTGASNRGVNKQVVEKSARGCRQWPRKWPVMCDSDGISISIECNKSFNFVVRFLQPPPDSFPHLRRLGDFVKVCVARIQSLPCFAMFRSDRNDFWFRH